MAELSETSFLHAYEFLTLKIILHVSSYHIIENNYSKK